MIGISFNKWTISGVDKYKYRRIYIRGFWTPFITVKKREPTRQRLLYNRAKVRRVKEIQEGIYKDLADSLPLEQREYKRGLVNGLKAADKILFHTMGYYIQKPGETDAIQGLRPGSETEQDQASDSNTQDPA